MIRQAKDTKIRRCATCVVKQDVFIRIAQRTFTKSSVSKPKHKGKSACLLSQGESCSDTESDEKVFGVSSLSPNPNV